MIRDTERRRLPSSVITHQRLRAGKTMVQGMDRTSTSLIDTIRRAFQERADPLWLYVGAWIGPSAYPDNARRCLVPPCATSRRCPRQSPSSPLARNGYLV